MNIFKLLGGLLFFSCFILSPAVGFAQISSSVEAFPIVYSDNSQDNLYVFCGEKGETKASLTATLPNGEAGSFDWEKLNVQSGSFEAYISGASTISNLADGCYRVKITSTSGVKIYRAWVFNNYLEAKAEITESGCSSFMLKGSLDSPAYNYIDLPTGQSKILGKGITVKWMQGDTPVGSVLSQTIYNPSFQDTDYSLDISDKFGCKANASVKYISIVPKASFDYTLGEQPGEKGNEAPLTVTFNNTSKNVDAGKYQWFLFKDLAKIKQEIESKTFTDSIMERIYSDDPSYTYEETGTYIVKLVAQKTSANTVCYRTAYSDNIVIAESFIDAPNFFTPDETGDPGKYIVQFFSMKSIKITIFNRWGKVLHVWENNNVPGFTKAVEESVWDGKVGGRMATPGVYYYVAEGRGRDGVRRKASGFFHLFREK